MLNLHLTHAGLWRWWSERGKLLSMRHCSVLTLECTCWVGWLCITRSEGSPNHHHNVTLLSITVLKCFMTRDDRPACMLVCAVMTHHTHLMLLGLRLIRPFHRKNNYNILLRIYGWSICPLIIRSRISLQSYSFVWCLCPSLSTTPNFHPCPRCASIITNAGINLCNCNLLTSLF